MSNISKELLWRGILSLGLAAGGIAGKPDAEMILKALRPSTTYARELDRSLADYTVLPSLVDRCRVVHPEYNPQYPIRIRVIRGIMVSFPDQPQSDIDSRANLVRANFANTINQELNPFVNYFLGINDEPQLNPTIIQANKPENQYIGLDGASEFGNEIRSKLPPSDYAYNPDTQRYVILDLIPLAFFGTSGMNAGSFGRMITTYKHFPPPTEIRRNTLRHESLHGIGIPHNPDSRSVMTQSNLNDPNVGILESDITNICESAAPTSTPTQTPTLPTPPTLTRRGFLPLTAIRSST